MFKGISLACITTTAALTSASLPSSGMALAVGEGFSGKRTSETSHVVHPLPSGDASVEATGTSIADLVRGLESDTGTRFLIDAETLDFLEDHELNFFESFEIPADARWSFVESLIAEEGGALEIVREEAPRLVAIHMGEDHSALRTRLVDSDDLEHYANHPALQIATVVQLSNSDVRHLANSMRPVSSFWQVTMAPAANSDAIVLTGAASSVVESARLLKAIDHTSGEAETEAVEGDEANKATVMKLEYADARQLANSLRAISTDPESLSVIPVGDANAIVISGRESFVDEYVDLIDQLDRASGEF